MVSRARKFGAEKTMVYRSAARLFSLPKILSGIPATSTRFTGSSSSSAPPTRMMET